MMINKDLGFLIKLAEIDKEASQLEPKITEVQDWLNGEIKAQKNAIEELANIKENTKKAKLEIANNDLAIQECNDKLAQIDKKMANIKSEQELRALDIENGLVKEKITFANEEIARLEKEIETFKEKETQLAEQITALEKKVEEAKVVAEEKISHIKDKLQKIFDSKDKIAKNIDNKVIVFYEKIRKWAKDTSVVPVKKQACSGCFIKINDRTFIELTQSDDIITCPHCGRILFLENVKVDSAS